MRTLHTICIREVLYLKRFLSFYSLRVGGWEGKMDISYQVSYKMLLIPVLLPSGNRAVHNKSQKGMASGEVLLLYYDNRDREHTILSPEQMLYIYVRLV